MNRVFAHHDSGNQYRQTDAQIAKTGGIFEFDGTQPTLTDGFGNKYWFIDTTGGNVAVMLPAADESISRVYTVKRLTAGINTITVSAVSGNIDNAATHSVPTQYDKFRYASDGTNYWVV